MACRCLCQRRSVDRRSIVGRLMQDDRRQRSGVVTWRQCREGSKGTSITIWPNGGLARFSARHETRLVHAWRHPDLRRLPRLSRQDATTSAKETMTGLVYRQISVKYPRQSEVTIFIKLPSGQSRTGQRPRRRHVLWARMRHAEGWRRRGYGPASNAGRHCRSQRRY
jgi:hypothetical protein